jgi:hypothetical protein
MEELVCSGRSYEAYGLRAFLLKVNFNDQAESMGTEFHDDVYGSIWGLAQSLAPGFNQALYCCTACSTAAASAAIAISPRDIDT